MTVFNNKKEFEAWLTKHSIDDDGNYQITKSKEQINKEKQYQFEVYKRWHKNNIQHVLDESRKRQRDIKQNTRILNEKFFAEERERLKQEET